jgi:hypothetical protein
LGGLRKEIIGPDIQDASGVCHKGVTSESIPVLSANGATLKEIYRKSLKNQNLDVVDFNRVAQGCRHYKEYTDKLAALANDDIEFSGLCLLGPNKQVEKMTGSLGLYR